MKKKLTKVGLVQIGDKFGDQYYLPYSIGVLQAYAKRNLEHYDEFVFSPPVYKKGKTDEAIEYLAEADIVFFSTYIWNYNISLDIARGVKLRNRNSVIVFGGPQVPESAEEMKKFLKGHLFIDIACYDEGEIPFLRILENLQRKRWKNVPSSGFLTDRNALVHNPKSERIKNLDEIPSPYLEGVFDMLMEAARRIAGRHLSRQTEVALIPVRFVIGVKRQKARFIHMA